MANRTNIERWVEALRSGRYKQGHYQLRAGDEFCCLGVACDVYDPTLWQLLDGHRRDDDYVYGVRHDDMVLPESVQEWLEVPPNPIVSRASGLRATLVYMNDDGATFEEIADAIEREWLR